MGITKDEAKRRIVVLSPKAIIPAEVLADGWVTVEDLVPEDIPTVPESFDGEQAKETALIFFSSGT